MDFLTKIKKLFIKKDEIPIDDVNKIVGETQKEQLITENADEFDKSIDRSELFDILNSVKIDLSKLALDRIESEADTISNYVNGLLKDLELHQDSLKDKRGLDDAIKRVGGKIKHIASHGLELKNLLASLEDHYYIPIIDALEKLNQRINNDGITQLIGKLEKDLNVVKELDTQITKIVGYNGLFNPEKNPKYKEEIQKEAEKRLVHGHLNQLLDTILVAVSDRTLSIKAKIEKNDPIEFAKRFI